MRLAAALQHDYGSAVTDPLSILRDIFGFHGFRGVQREVVDRVMAGEHTLAVMPTGSRLPNRSCRTQEEWDREAAQYQRDAEQQRRNHESVQPGAFTRAF